jgi:hypothetical protein
MFGQHGSLRRFCSIVLFFLVLGLSLAACGNGGSSPTPTTVPLKVTSVEIAIGPSLNGHTCGSQFTETYTATFHLAPDGPGGTIVFQYTTDNGRGTSPNVSLPVAAGQTTATYQFTWSGKLPADHTAPGTGIVLMSAPNQGEAPATIPSGSCS